MGLGLEWELNQGEQLSVAEEKKGVIRLLSNVVAVKNIQKVS